MSSEHQLDDLGETVITNISTAVESGKTSASPGFNSNENDGVKGNFPDEKGDDRFIVIKPNDMAAANPNCFERKEEGETSLPSNVIVIQNSMELNLEELGADVLNQVKEALEKSGMEHSLMIVNEQDANNTNNDDIVKETSYVIDMNLDDISLPANRVTEISEVMKGQSAPIKDQVTVQDSSSSSLFTELVTTSLNQKGMSLSPLTATSQRNVERDEVEPSTITASPTFSSLSIHDVISETSFFNGIGTTHSHSLPQSHSISEDIVAENKQDRNASSSSTTLKNLSQPTPTPSQDNSNFHPSSAEDKHSSHVAEQLINIAKKMIKEGSTSSQRISVDETKSKIVITPEQKSSGEKNSDSVITMYLSSPNELKTRLQKFKTDSPVIIVQAGEESLTEEEEEEDNDDSFNNSEQENRAPHHFTNTNMEYSMTADALTTLTSNQEQAMNQKTDSGASQSESLVAALSSLASDSVLYSCSECGYSSHNKHYYKQHVDLVHNEDRPYKCPHCDYAGKRRHALLEHMIVHSDQRPYTCSYCNASFRKKGHLTNHVKLHTSQRLVQCGVCSMQLPDAEAFEAHLRKFHNTDKLYKCQICDHTVVDRQSMLNHLVSHNENVIYSCPHCTSCFKGEKMLQEHLKDVHKIFNAGVSVPERGKQEKRVDVESLSAVPAEEKLPQQAKIVCSECGYICGDALLMRKHMWVHIDPSSDMNVQLKGAAPKSESHSGGVQHSGGVLGSSSPLNTSNTLSSSSALGVLKMNVVSGLKTLPDNVMYQCTSCNFTSSDNSVFIKHMLLHKTQRKSSLPIANQEGNTDVNEPSIANTKIEGKAISVLPNVTLNARALNDGSAVKGKPLSSVPFVFDESTGRFRCLICGYHCDYQRTIKAHIWKHSGHQNIEYPVFDPNSKSESSTSTSSTQQATVYEECQRKALHTVTSSATSTPFPKPISTSPPVVPGQPVHLLKTSTGEVVKLMPVDPKSKSKYKPGELIQIKDSAIVFPEITEDSNMTVANTFSKPVVVTVANHNNLNQYNSNEATFSAAATTSFSEELTKPMKIVEVTTSDFAEQKMENSLFRSIKESELTMISTLPFSHMDEIVEVKSEPINRPTGISEEGCTEPSVVVEIVDSVPSGLDVLTGMKSQQGSPRVSDLECSGGEGKLSSALKEAFVSDIGLPSTSGNNAYTNSNHKPTEVEPGSGRHKYNLRKPKNAKNGKKQLQFQSQKEKNIFETTVVGKDIEKKEPTEKNQINDRKRKRSEDTDENMEEMHSNDSDTTESSDEVYSNGESGASTNPPKTGICSSLLAVIEQLRERSRSESGDKDKSPSKDVPPKRGGKRGKNISSSNALDTTAPPLDEYQNIEKINTGDSEKFRCSLCHYTSERIFNMKIHMKTHRQKKPSECSLCEFSSDIPEALQEHMLRHCKIRTYACKFCPQNFNHKSTLRAHMRAHKETDPYLCAYCIYEASSPTDLKEHMLVHSGCSSRLRCPKCDQIMINKEELTAHLYKCKVKCNQIATSSAGATGQPGEIVKMKQEANASCESPNEYSPVEIFEDKDNSSASAATEHACVVKGCAFTSYNLKELQEHLSIHCNPSLLLCDLCDFKALHSRSLKSHMKRHANDQRYVQQPLEQYKCNLCGYVCHHLPSLKSHMWRHASDQSYSYEFTNDVINAAIDHDSRIDANALEADDPELLDRVINSERKIMEGELTKSGKGDGQRPTCWVTFRCCSCGFETINKAKLNIHMRSHSDIIKQTLEGVGRKPGQDKSNYVPNVAFAMSKTAVKRTIGDTIENDEPILNPKMKK